MPDDRKPAKPGASSEDVRRELLRQMREIRESLDPKLVERAKLAVFGKVPFDRDSARQAVASFLDTRKDGGAFRRKLEAELRKDGAGIDPATPPARTVPSPLPGKAGIDELTSGREAPAGSAPAVPDEPPPPPPRRWFNRIV